MAKNHAGVGPGFPQVVVLFGATGDLSHRKLLPGLFRLTCIGFIPATRIIGVSLEDIDAEAFRKIARQALDEFSTHRSLTKTGRPSRRLSTTCPSRPVRPR